MSPLMILRKYASEKVDTFIILTIVNTLVNQGGGVIIEELKSD